MGISILSILVLISMVVGITALTMMFVFNARIQRQLYPRGDELKRALRTITDRLWKLEDQGRIFIPYENPKTSSRGKKLTLQTALIMIGTYLNLGYRVIEAPPSVASLVKGKKKKKG